MGIGTDACAIVLSDPNINALFGEFINANTQCNINLEMDVENMPHLYSMCDCSSLGNVDAYGYEVTGYTFDQNAAPVFTADYPTSSPYVTSVGATQFLDNGDGTYDEVACSILTGAIITTGGGFSSFQPMPDYQIDTVNDYLSEHSDTLPPSFAFNPAMRAYPDVAFNGHHYQIYISNSTSDSCPCLGTQVDGTSCSSPAFSGLVSLINDQLFTMGKSSLGFLNPLLYTMYDEKPEAFNDIVDGNNNCNRAYCCEYGYQAVEGYDAVSGLGSPDFENMLEYILDAKSKSRY